VFFLSISIFYYWVNQNCRWNWNQFSKYCCKSSSKN